MTLTHLCEHTVPHLCRPFIDVARTSGHANLTRSVRDNTVPIRHNTADIEPVNRDRRTTVSITLKSATALILAVLVSISTAATSQAADVTPLGGATGCCRMALQ